MDVLEREAIENANQCYFRCKPMGIVIAMAWREHIRSEMATDTLRDSMWEYSPWPVKLDHGSGAPMVNSILLVGQFRMPEEIAIDEVIHL